MAPPHLLLSNDFPPKNGGIQRYLYELWCRLDPESFSVLTRYFPGSEEFDARQNFRIYRVKQPVLVPTPALLRTARVRLAQLGGRLVVVDPLLPTGVSGPVLKHRGIPYAVVLHGAEVTVPLSLPLLSRMAGAVMKNASLLIAAGSYPASLAQKALQDGPAPPIVEVPPPVDTDLFRPAEDSQRRALRKELGFKEEDLIVLGVSRLVPRKGFDVLFRACSGLKAQFPSLKVVLVGGGRDAARLKALASLWRIPVLFKGEVGLDSLVSLYRCADVFAMLCRSRWLGLEQEGFGMVFAEAQACAVPVVAGLSGGSADAIEDGKGGYLIKEPRNPFKVAEALRALLADPVKRKRMGASGRAFVERNFSAKELARRLDQALAQVVPA